MFVRYRRADMLLLARQLISKWGTVVLVDRTMIDQSRSPNRFLHHNAASPSTGEKVQTESSGRVVRPNGR